MATVIMKTKLNNVDPLDWLATNAFWKLLPDPKSTIYIYIDMGAPRVSLVSPRCKASIHCKAKHTL